MKTQILEIKELSAVQSDQSWSKRRLSQPRVCTPSKIRDKLPDTSRCLWIARYKETRDFSLLYSYFNFNLNNFNKAIYQITVIESNTNTHTQTHTHTHTYI